ncbi:alpha-hydroxy acid oxidase [Streptomyces sp. SL13]|uniref:Alpha-hydroxy acid oxidase n=1 Tax=Streptantibioticus silvisoli TaxID=2705255 RepID=A0AA90K007_9ACTN|nr:alpha-hydroxy acid oxidase [Streptantibioticus silvisoli]MDI5972611.1 alpha-hydroxy acid oxidase [Streptantibioticus silvisoli]
MTAPALPRLPEAPAAHTVLNLREYETIARGLLDPIFYDYVAGGARDEVTVRANEHGFARLGLLPRMLRGSDTRDLGVTLFGTPSSLPVFLSPTAFHRLAHPDGELATARAAAKAGVIMTVGMASTTSVADVAAAARQAVPDRAPALWFQLYLQPDMAVTRALVRRAEAAGCTALLVTVDSPVLGIHERNKRNGFNDLPPGVVCENLRDLTGSEPGHIRQIAMSADLGWDHLDRLREMTSLPVVLKGVLHPEDGRTAVAHGVDGLLLSNHGGRQLDTAPATVDLLPDMLAAVAGRVPVLLDGGVRRGTDVVKALALGATAVGIGRPVVYGLAAGGEDGVRHVVDLLREEIDHTLALCGATAPRDLTPDLVRTVPAVPR